MQIFIHLEWSTGKALSFKHSAMKDMYSEYIKRLSKFSPIQTKGPISQSVSGQSPSRIWLLDRGSVSKILSSEQVANELGKVLNGGIQNLHVVIGGPDGFSEAEIKKMNPSLRWSFGPMTLPHELAAVVAAEQLYRAWAQLKNLPYHKGH